jgi:hypothetical protein
MRARIIRPSRATTTPDDWSVAYFYHFPQQWHWVPCTALARLMPAIKRVLAVGVSAPAPRPPGTHRSASLLLWACQILCRNFCNWEYAAANDGLVGVGYAQRERGPYNSLGIEKVEQIYTTTQCPITWPTHTP